MYRFLIVLLVLLCVGVPVSCDSGAGDYGEVVNGIANVVVHSDYSQDVSYNELPPEVKGQLDRGIGFVRPEHRDIPPYERPQTEEFRLEEDETFAPFIILGNGAQESRIILLAAILDYSQVIFKLDGKNGLLHEVTIPPETDMYIPFSVNIEGQGAHDIQVVFFDDPYNLTLDYEYRMSFDTYVISRRAVVIVGEDETPARSLQPLITGAPIPYDVTFKPWVGFASAPSSEDIHPSKRQLYVGEAIAGELYPLQMFLNNTRNEAVVYAMIPFLDYHQVEINDLDVLVADLKPEQGAVVDVELAMPEEPGIHQFQVIYLFDPYQSIFRDEVLNPFVIASFRIAIDARQQE